MERKIPEWMLRSKAEPACDETYSSDLSFPGKIKLISTYCDCCYVSEAFLEKLKTVSKHLLVGFDMEWPIHGPMGQGKTALIQLCFSAQVCYLFYVSEWKTLPKIFIDFISHPKVRLVGLNINCDLWKLSRDFNISVMSIINDNAIEMTTFANKELSVQENWSLDRLTLYVLKKKLNKTGDIRMSHWASNNLTQEQLMYAATDAYACLLVSIRLQEINEKLINEKDV